MRKILFIKHADSSFILTDQHVLEKKYRVIPLTFHRGKKGFSFILDMAGLVFFILRNGWGNCLFVTWFGDYHSAVIALMGKLMHKRVIIFAGGQEAISYPELGKGVYHNKWRGRCVKYALRNASMIIPNHKSLLWHENFYYSGDGKKDGITYYIPGIKTPFTVIPNGIDTNKYFRDPSISKEPKHVLTVGTMSSRADFLNKGFDLFVELARRNPDLTFTLTGIKKPFMPWIEENYCISQLANLSLIFSFCPDEVLFREYNRAKVFVQASITEGMPNTLSEAMLCECIPVGSDVNGIPDAIGETGIIVKKRDIIELEKAVRSALILDSGSRAREHVLLNFTRDRREARILGLFESFT